MIRRFVTDPVLAYKAKKGEEPDPQIAPVLDRGMEFLAEFAEPIDMKKYKREQEKAAS